MQKVREIGWKEVEESSGLPGLCIWMMAADFQQEGKGVRKPGPVQDVEMLLGQWGGGKLVQISYLSSWLLTLHCATKVRGSNGSEFRMSSKSPHKPWTPVRKPSEAMMCKLKITSEVTCFHILEENSSISA